MPQWINYAMQPTTTISKCREHGGLDLQLIALGSGGFCAQVEKLANHKQFYDKNHGAIDILADYRVSQYNPKETV